ncbi:hypothetical protein [Paenibacillus sp. KN14-4R]|uniref:hypothetical protein n=1 Tax=Paenibacillus sp. KN14-4R TaxID=3445773 RepID=UPI003FA1374D
MALVMEHLPNLNHSPLVQNKIDSIEIFRLKSCGLIKVSCNGFCGWGMFDVTCPQQQRDLVQWASVYMVLKRLSVTEALELIQIKSEVWGLDRRYAIEVALTNLMDKLSQRSSLQRRSEGVFHRSFLLEISDAYFSF